MEQEHEHDLNLAGYIEGILPKEENQKIERHIDSCDQCRDTLDVMKKSLKIISKIYKEEKEKPDFLLPLLERKEKDPFDLSETDPGEPLPNSLKSLIKKKELHNALSRLKNKFITDVETLVDQFFPHDTAPGFSTEPELSYAAYNDITMQAQPSPRLRIPSYPRNIQFHIQDHDIEINKTASETRITITKNKTPVSDIEITVTTESGEVKKIKSNDLGRVIL